MTCLTSFGGRASALVLGRATPRMARRRIADPPRHAGPQVVTSANLADLAAAAVEQGQSLRWRWLHHLGQSAHRHSVQSARTRACLERSAKASRLGTPWHSDSLVLPLGAKCRLCGPPSPPLPRSGEPDPVWSRPSAASQNQVWPTSVVVHEAHAGAEARARLNRPGPATPSPALDSH